MGVSPATHFDGGQGVAYASPSQVAGRDRGYTYTASSQVSLGDLDEYLAQAAAELNGVLRAQGYQLPIPESATYTLELLQTYNIDGAIARARDAEPSTGGKRSDAMRLWQQTLKMIASGDVVFDAPKDEQTGLPRHGGRATAMFNRCMDL
jgi:hypothetical protein